MNEKSKNTIPNIWTAQENLIHFYRLLSIGLAGIAIGMAVIAGILGFQDPIVVVKSEEAQEFFNSRRAPVSIEKKDVESITRRFLDALYVWPEFNGQALAKEIAPYAEDALVGKIVETQALKYGKDFKGKKLAQEISFVKVDVLEDRVVCTFDRILKIEGIPLVIPTEVTLSMLRGSSTRENPMGVFVSGILENEGAK
ncbi:MAG: hypothetical protein KF865_06440 [Bdellovibrionaceae bacterium]|nr:hypothetical protein [Pseudobdellovibrionaceae bacterium]